MGLNQQVNLQLGTHNDILAQFKVTQASGLFTVQCPLAHGLALVNMITLVILRPPPWKDPHLFIFHFGKLHSCTILHYKNSLKSTRKHKHRGKKRRGGMGEWRGQETRVSWFSCDVKGCTLSFCKEVVWGISDFNSKLWCFWFWWNYADHTRFKIFKILITTQN